MRRLITLISAGSRTIVIRRELSRTEDAGWVETPYRRKSDSSSQTPYIDANELAPGRRGLEKAGLAR
jgi:hypothetical protein